jgi:hypothetical protein
MQPASRASTCIRSPSARRTASSSCSTRTTGYSGYALGVDRSRSKKVPLRHAGRALAALGIERADVIKIDTEGAEWEILTALDPALLKSARVIMGELHGRRDFELLAFLQPAFHIGAKKQLRSRLFNFFAVNREVG